MVTLSLFLFISDLWSSNYSFQGPIAQLLTFRNWWVWGRITVCHGTTYGRGWSWCWLLSQRLFGAVYQEGGAKWPFCLTQPMCLPLCDPYCPSSREVMEPERTQTSHPPAGWSLPCCSWHFQPNVNSMRPEARTHWLMRSWSLLSPHGFPQLQCWPQPKQYMRSFVSGAPGHTAGHGSSLSLLKGEIEAEQYSKPNWECASILNLKALTCEPSRPSFNFCLK